MARASRKSKQHNTQSDAQQLLEQLLRHTPQGYTLAQNGKALGYHIRSFTTSALKKLVVGFRYISLSARYQFLVIAIFFVVSLILSREGSSLYTFIKLTDGIMITYLSAISQSLAALVAILLAILLFNFQLIDQRRISVYTDFRAEMDKISDVYLNHLPTVSKALTESIASFIDTFGSIKISELPSDWSVSDRGEWNKSVGDIHRFWEAFKDRLPANTSLPYMQLMLNLTRFDNILYRLDLINIAIISMNLLIHSVIKLSILLVVSILLIPFFGVQDLKNIFPDLTFPILVTISLWLSLIFCEIIIHIGDLYRDFRDGF